MTRNNLRLVLEGSTRTRRNTNRLCSGPHAVGISDASSLCGILGHAGKRADGLVGIGVNTDSRVGLTVETRIVNGATKITTSSTVGKFSVRTFQLTFEIDPFADTSGGTNSLITDLGTGRSAGTNTRIPHAITRSRVASGLIQEAETTLERASLRGVVVDTSSRLLFALFSSRDRVASIETSSHCWVPNTGRIGSASKETIETARFAANGGGVVVDAHWVSATRISGNVFGASVDARSSVTNHAKRIEYASSEISLLGILVVASVIANTAVDCTLRTRSADKRRGDVRTFLTAHETSGIPEAERVSIGGTAVSIVVLDVAAANTSQIGEGSRNEAHGFRVANLGVEEAAVRFTNLESRVPHGVVERIVDTIVHGGITNFRNDNAAKNTSADVTENTTTVKTAFVERTFGAASDAHT